MWQRRRCARQRLRFAINTLLCVLLAPLLTGQALAAADQPQAVSVPSEPKITVGEPATLTVWNRSIVTLRAGIDGMAPQTRVETIRKRIDDLPAAALSDHVGLVQGTLGTVPVYWVYLDGRAVLRLFPEDVDPDSSDTLAQLAQAAAQQLGDALRARADHRRFDVLIRAAVITVLATALFAALLWVIARLRARALRRLMIRMELRPLSIRGVNLRPYLRAVEDSVVKLTALGAALVAGYIWLTTILLQFPYSRPWGEGLGHWLASLLGDLGAGALTAVPGFFTVIVIFLATRLVVQAANHFFSSVEGGWLRVSWLEAETARATRRLAIVLIWIFALTVAYPYIPGSESDAFKGVSVFLGLMVSLGSAGFVNQVMSGLVIVYSRSLKSGEFVQVGDTQGQITEIGVLATKLVTPTRQEITIPNAALVTSAITNFSRLADAEHGSIIATTVTIGYDTPWRQVHAMLLLAAERTPEVRSEPKPRVLQRALSDFYVEYQLLISIDRPDTQRNVLSDLHAQVQDVFNEFGVQIMSPHFEMQPEAKVWVPKETWFAPPTVSTEPSDRGSANAHLQSAGPRKGDRTTSRDGPASPS